MNFVKAFGASTALVALTTSACTSVPGFRGTPAYPTVPYMNPQIEPRICADYRNATRYTYTNDRVARDTGNLVGDALKGILGSNDRTRDYSKDRTLQGVGNVVGSGMTNENRYQNTMNMYNACIQAQNAVLSGQDCINRTTDSSSVYTRNNRIDGEPMGRVNSTTTCRGVGSYNGPALGLGAPPVQSQGNYQQPRDSYTATPQGGYAPAPQSNARPQGGGVMCGLGETPRVLKDTQGRTVTACVPNTP